MSSYTIPNVVEKRPTGERALDIYSRLLSDRIVYLGTELDDGVANVIVAQLLHLESEDAEREINLYLNSPGGSMTAMLAIYDTIQFIHAPVATTCVGQAASAAAVLLAAGSPGRRAILPHGRVLLHQPSAEGRGTLPDLVLHAREVMRIRAQLEEVLAGHTGQSMQQLRADTDRDKILTAEEAVAYGIVDAVITSRKDDPSERGRHPSSGEGDRPGRAA